MKHHKVLTLISQIERELKKEQTEYKDIISRNFDANSVNPFPT